MAFEDKSPISQVILFDAAGNAIAVQDGVAIPVSTPRLLIAGSEGGTARTLNVDSSGNLSVQNPPNLDVALSTRATEATLATRATEATLLTRATEATLATKASEATLLTRATEATLATRATEATLATRATEATLVSIKDTDGIKKITDSLPAGSNILGRLGLRSNTKGTSTAADLTSENVDANIEALHTDLEGWFGSTAPTVGQKLMASALPVSVASDQSPIEVITTVAPSEGAIVTLLEDGGASSDMVVNGSVTPVVFDFTADPANNIQLTGLRLVFTASLLYDGGSFGKGGGPLTNGVEIDIEANNGGFISQLAVLFVNEDFWRFLSVDNATSALVAASLPFAGAVLEAGTTDFVSVTINDNLTSGVRGINYFTATLFGVIV